MNLVAALCVCSLVECLDICNLIGDGDYGPWNVTSTPQTKEGLEEETVEKGTDVYSDFFCGVW